MSPASAAVATFPPVGAILSASQAVNDFKSPPNQERISLGLLIYCFSLAQRARSEVPGIPNYNDPVVFIQEAARIGASAVQIPFGILKPEAIRTIRDVAEASGIALESTVGLPQSGAEISRFEEEMQTLRELGIQVARTVVFPGRRYEDLHSYQAYLDLLQAARERLRRAEPLAKKWSIQLAVENHKDQRMDERLKLLEEFSSEFIGACIDVGNNISLLEDPIEVCRALAPWALTVHFKDQGVREYEEGFLLADLALGQGCIDLPSTIQIIREKKPKVQFHLELITRDALQVPVLNDKYWSTFAHLKAPVLARAWNVIKARSSTVPFPVVSALSAAEKVAMERKNIEDSFRFATDHLDFSI